MRFQDEMKKLADEYTGVGVSNARFTALALAKIVEKIDDLESRISAIDDPTRA